MDLRDKAYVLTTLGGTADRCSPRPRAEHL